MQFAPISSLELINGISEILGHRRHFNGGGLKRPLLMLVALTLLGMALVALVLDRLRTSLAQCGRMP